MPKAYGAEQRVEVIFTVDGGGPHLGRAVLIEGYSTVDDLPAILGIPRDVPQREARDRVQILSIYYPEETSTGS